MLMDVPSLEAELGAKHTASINHTGGIYSSEQKNTHFPVSEKQYQAPKRLFHTIQASLSTILIPIFQLQTCQR